MKNKAGYKPTPILETLKAPEQMIDEIRKMIQEIGKKFGQSKFQVLEGSVPRIHTPIYELIDYGIGTLKFNVKSLTAKISTMGSKDPSQESRLSHLLEERLKYVMNAVQAVYDFLLSFESVGSHEMKSADLVEINRLAGDANLANAALTNPIDEG